MNEWKSHRGFENKIDFQRQGLYSLVKIRQELGSEIAAFEKRKEKSMKSKVSQRKRRELESHSWVLGSGSVRRRPRRSSACQRRTLLCAPAHSLPTVCLVCTYCVRSLCLLCTFFLPSVWNKEEGIQPVFQPRTIHTLSTVLCTLLQKDQGRCRHKIPANESICFPSLLSSLL